jgi:CRISPR-associated protein (TIGR02584 family)
MKTKTAKPLVPPAASAAQEVVLLAVTGMSPAILTETIWALAQEAPSIVPTRVLVLTTLRGKDEIQRQLFTPLPAFAGKTAWEALREALAPQHPHLEGKLRFGITGDDIRVITALDPKTHCSQELGDIRTRHDNDAAADFILEHVRSIVENPDQQLIASLAGGRKTMGALLYACMSLAARDTDRLTHVLVSEPYEMLRGFYFPAQPPGGLSDLQGRPIDPAQARIELADVPFVALRNLFVRELHRKAGRFGRLVESCREGIRQQAAERVKLVVETARPEIEVNGCRIKLSAREHLLLHFLARRAKHHQPEYSAFKDGVDDLEHYRAETVKNAPHDNFGDWRNSDTLRTPVASDGGDQEVRRLLSRIRSKLDAAGGEAVYLSSCLPEKGRLSLRVAPSLIFIKP